MDYTTERVLGKDPRGYCVGPSGAEITAEAKIGTDVMVGERRRRLAGPREKEPDIMNLAAWAATPFEPGALRWSLFLVDPGEVRLILHSMRQPR